MLVSWIISVIYEENIKELQRNKEKDMVGWKIKKTSFSSEKFLSRVGKWKANKKLFNIKKKKERK